MNNSITTTISRTGMFNAIPLDEITWMSGMVWTFLPSSHTLPNKSWTPQGLRLVNLEIISPVCTKESLCRKPAEKRNSDWDIPLSTNYMRFAIFPLTFTFLVFAAHLAFLSFSFCLVFCFFFNISDFHHLLWEILNNQVFKLVDPSRGKSLLILDFL